MLNIFKYKSQLFLVISTFFILSILVLHNISCRKEPLESPAFDIYKEAVSAYDKERYSEALLLVEKAIGRDDKLTIAWTLKGECLLKLGRSDEALKSFDRAIEIEPGDFIVLTVKGALLDDMGRREEALKILQDAIVIKPDYAPAWFYKARALCRMEKKEEAVKAYEEAIDNNIDMVEAFTNLGILLIDLGRYDEAYNIYDRMMKKYPDIIGLALYCKAAVSAMRGDKKLMIEQLRECFKLEPSYRNYIMTDRMFTRYWEDKDFIDVATLK
ncbi:MAG: tetratricopeptide repeat protein [bacterium]